MGRLVEMQWDCKYCGTNGIRGGIRECPNCGKPRDEGTSFYLDKQKITYVPKEQARTINRNPDWICPYCNSLNSDDDTLCKSCGSERTAENLNYFQNKQKQSEKKIKQDSIDVECIDETQKDDNNSLSNYDLKKSFVSTKTFISENLIYILSAFIGILAIIGIIFLFIPKNEELTIKDFSWSRSIDIERYQTVNESDWNLPYGARLKYTSSEFYCYEEVIDHYETKSEVVTKERISGYEEYVSGYRDLGNGYAEEIVSTRPVYETYTEIETHQEPVYRDEPVYKTKYYYEIDKWLHERSIKTSASDKNPYWGNYSLYSDERVAGKFETYSIIGFDKKDKEKKINLSYEDWESLTYGDKAKFKVTLGYGKIVE